MKLNKNNMMEEVELPRLLSFMGYCGLHQSLPNGHEHTRIKGNTNTNKVITEKLLKRELKRKKKK